MIKQYENFNLEQEVVVTKGGNMYFLREQGRF